MNRPSKNQWIVTLLIHSRKECKRGSSIPNHYLQIAAVDEGEIRTVVETSRFVETRGFLLSSTIFGGIHFAAMESIFPRHTDKILWIVASAICTGVGPLVFALWILSITCPLFLGHKFLAFDGINVATIDWGKLMTRILRWITAFLVVLYILARLVLIVELFRGLFSLPPSAFVSTWVSSVPHIS